MTRSAINVLFPVSGVVRRHSFQTQAPYTCFAALNVIPDDPFLERERGGSRPGTEVIPGGGISGPVQWVGSVGFRDSNGDLQRRVCAIGGGNFYFREDDDTFTQKGTGLATDVVTAVELNSKVYISGKDNPDRTVQVFDPVADTFGDLTATEGTLPTTCRFINRFRNRLVLCGEDSNPNNVFMSRIGNVQDWDYGAVDSGRAINFINSEAGVVGEPVTAVIEHTDDCIIFGCHNSVWIVRGDPGFGGVVEKLANETGIVTHQSFCYSPDGYLWFLSQEGLYGMAGRCGGPVFSVSREKLPQELRGIDRDKYTVSMVYDQGLRGILIFVTETNHSGGTFNDTPFGDDTPIGSPPPPGGTLVTNHFFVDIRNSVSSDISHRAGASFWPITLPRAHEPTACASLVGGTGPFGFGVMGTRSGGLRRFNNTLEKDEDDDFTSYVMIGPIMLGDAFNEGSLCEITPVMAYDSEDAEFELYVADSPEEALHLASAPYSRTCHASDNRTYYPRLRGSAAYILVRGVNKRWALEGFTVVREKLGRKRRRTHSVRGLQGSTGADPIP